MAFICRKQTSSVLFASLSSSFSPMHGIKCRPAARAWATFSPISCDTHRRATHRRAYKWATFSPISCKIHTDMHINEQLSHQSAVTYTYMHINMQLSHQSAARYTHTCIWMSNFLTNQLQDTHRHAYEWATFSPISCKILTDMHMNEQLSHQSAVIYTHHTTVFISDWISSPSVCNYWK